MIRVVNEIFWEIVSCGVHGEFLGGFIKSFEDMDLLLVFRCWERWQVVQNGNIAAKLTF